MERSATLGGVYNMENNYITVMCPHCGKLMDIPYIYDGTYEIVHRETYYRNGLQSGCTQTFHVAIIDGRLHVHKTKEDLNTTLKLLMQ